eukprot:Phypoly_transcript_08203.p1 GENE.Phypoly_transcript_08203~~Phypoly_transcript_08203.p1  ORF type:complete len:412 (+),score=31.56 Phypoly_transcript_08203:177-1412(+)
MDGNNNSNEVTITLSPAQQRRRHLIGLCLAVCVVIIWVSSSVLIQMIFQDADFNKPFFLTYLSTSLFSVYLFGFAIRWKKWTANLGFPSLSKNYTTPVESQDRVDEDLSQDRADEDLSQDRVDADPSQDTPADNTQNTTKTLTKLSVYEVIKLSALFCPIWFIANYPYNVGLAMTSVSSNTILSTLSGLFSLILSSLMGVDRFTVWKLIAAIVTLGGVALVSELDTKEGKESALGDIYTVIGAIVYALYCTLLKKKLVHESRLDMTMFFGFVGIINFVTLWPFLLIWNATGIETFEMPSPRVWMFLLINAAIGTVVSDYLEAWSIIFTTPLINTIGLSLSIPFAMVSDILRGARTFPPLYYFGSLLVLVGFVLVNLSSGTFEASFLSWVSRVSSRLRSLVCRRPHPEPEDA